MIRYLILFIGICVVSVPPLTASAQSLPGEIAKGVNQNTSGNRDDRLVYRVQICALRRLVKDVHVLQRKTKVPGPYYVSRYNGFHRYSVGRFFSFKNAMHYRAYLINHGVDKLIFVVAFYRGKQLTAGPDLKPSSFLFP